MSANPLKWWQYAQNNSGGDFTGPAHLVFVKAATADQADAVAVQHGIYFNGCDTGEDCECCGDRWSYATKPYYSVDSDLLFDKSLLVAVDGIAFLLRDKAGQWDDSYAALTEQARTEVQAQLDEQDRLWKAAHP
jgi:hypothetical protein